MELELPDGRTVRVHDSGVSGPAVFWHHGSPQTGAPLDPLLRATTERGIRLLSYDRPGYGESTEYPGRTVATAAADVEAIADALGIARFAVMGHSGGGPHALACGALLSDRVSAVVSMSSLAPFGAEGLDWFAGMADAGAAELRASIAGRPALEAYLASASFDEELFTAADHAALADTWASLGANAGNAMADGLDGLVDDDLAFVTAWGFAPEQVTAPALVVHGADDRFVPSSHGEWLARRCDSAEWWPSPGDGHISVLNRCEGVLDWLGDHAGR
jgi:pimeloyl-ACP methyl ester carboxylesterase